MVAARIVHARGAVRGSSPQQRRGGRSSRGGGVPPKLPPPLPEARVMVAAGKTGRRGSAVVAVDLLELEAELPGVEVSEPGVGGVNSRKALFCFYS